MKKYLLIALSTGGGHTMVANTIAESLFKKGYTINVIDLFKQIDARALDILICGGYNLMATKIPRMYGTVYKTGNKPSVAKCSFDLTRRLCQKKIKELIDFYNPNTIVAVHPIVTDILGGMKQKGLINNIKLISIITDYLSHYVYIRKHKYLDAYFVGSNFTKNDLISRGVNSEKIYNYGIPVKNEFYVHEKNIIKKNSKNINSILIMAGSLGLKQMDKVIISLFKIKKFLKITVVCGKDDELKNKINKYVDINKDKSKKIIVFGFIDKISKLMDEADLLITKPGGISITEALLRRIPLIFPYLVGGQEKENLDYFVKQGVAIWIKTYKKIPFVVEQLLNDYKKIETIKEKMKMLSSLFSKEKIIEKIEDI